MVINGIKESEVAVETKDVTGEMMDSMIDMTAVEKRGTGKRKRLKHGARRRGYVQGKG